MKFEWDENKRKTNLQKHKISFDEAESAFYDEYAIKYSDIEHSNDDEDRFILLGMSALLKILVVVHCYRDEEDVIRIISARKATKREQKTYKEFGK